MQKAPKLGVATALNGIANQRCGIVKAAWWCFLGENHTMDSSRKFEGGFVDEKHRIEFATF